jgi:polyhydroxybutyrate depolymerase
VARLSCTSTPTVEDLPDKASDGTSARRETYSGCMGGARVVLVSIEGAGHTWPGGDQYLSAERIGGLTRDFSASDMAWAFFSTHPLP